MVREKKKNQTKKKGKDQQKSSEPRSQTVSYLAQLLSRGKVDLVKQIIKNDLSLILAADEQNLTPLHHACHAGSFRLAKFLLARNASITARDEKGWNPLHCLGASQSEGEVFVKMCQLFLESENADRALMAKTDSGSTFLHFLLANMTIDEDAMGDILRSCIRLNADIDAQNEKGEAPLHRAALSGRAIMCRVLVEAGARLDVRTKIGQTPLHLGIFAEWVPVCDVLLELGADIKVASEEGTCEDLALQTRNTELKELFQSYLKNQGTFKRLDNLRKKKVVMGKYRIGERLGSGAFGVVYKGLDLQNGRLVAIKQANRRLLPKKELPRLQVEVQAMRRLTHPNCVQLYDYEETDQEISFIIEFMGGGSLRDAMDTFGTFPEVLLAGYMRDVLIALSFLHKNEVIHRDIKAGNILLTNDGRCKLADFGSCFLAEKGGHLSIVGSPYWMSPEMVEGKASTSGKSDIWSLGITLIELVWGHPPHYEKTKMQAMIAIVDLALPPWHFEELSDEMNDFLVGCFIKLEQFRPSADELLSHPWVSGKKVDEGSLPYSHFHDLKKKDPVSDDEEEAEGTSSSSVIGASDPTTTPPHTPSGSSRLREYPEENGNEKGKRKMSSSADCLKKEGEQETGEGEKLSHSEGGAVLVKKVEEEEEEEESEDEDDDKYDEDDDDDEEDKEEKQDKEEKEEKEEKENKEDKEGDKENKEDDKEDDTLNKVDKTLSDGSEMATLKVPFNQGPELIRCESDSKIPPKSVHGSPVPFCQEKSQSTPFIADGSMPKREHSRLIQFSNISKNQFRQNAPLTVKRPRSPPTGRATSSPSSSVSGSPSSPSHSSPLATSEGSEIREGEEETSDKRGRRTTLAITPSREEELKGKGSPGGRESSGDEGGKVFGRVLSVNRLGGKAREKRDSVRTSIARKKDSRKLDKDKE